MADWLHRSGSRYSPIPIERQVSASSCRWRPAAVWRLSRPLFSRPFMQCGAECCAMAGPTALGPAPLRRQNWGYARQRWSHDPGHDCPVMDWLLLRFNSLQSTILHCSGRCARPDDGHGMEVSIIVLEASISVADRHLCVACTSEATTIEVGWLS